jgi:hypothetical protein
MNTFQIGDRVRAVDVIDHEDECGTIVEVRDGSRLVTVLMDNDKQRYWCMADFLELAAERVTQPCLFDDVV